MIVALVKMSGMIYLLSCMGGSRSLVVQLCDRVMSLRFSVMICGTLLDCSC